MEIVHVIFSFQNYICCTNRSRVTSSAYRQAWNEYIFYTKSNTFSNNIGDTVGYKIFINFWIYDVICPCMLKDNIRYHIRFV